MDIGKLLTDEVEADVEFQDATIRVRHVPRSKVLSILNKSTRIGWDSRHQKEEKIDAALSNRLMGEAAVVGWSGLTQDGEEFPFTPENRDLLMEKWGEFCTFVNNICTDLSALVEAGREEGKKNFSTT